jgi:hypothetical protein
MQINPPFGYSEIVPLYRGQKVRLPAPGALPEFCRRVKAPCQPERARPSRSRIAAHSAAAGGSSTRI